MDAAVSNQVSIIDGNASRRHRAGRGKSTTSFPSMRVRTPSHDPSKEPIPRHRRGTPCLVHFMRPAPLSPLPPMLGPRGDLRAPSSGAHCGGTNMIYWNQTRLCCKVCHPFPHAVEAWCVRGGEALCGPGRLTWPHIRRHFSRAGVRSQQRWRGPAHGVDQPFSLEPGRREWDGLDPTVW